MIDLTAFCHPETSRVALLAPFASGAYSYASDGCIMVRVPRRECDPEHAKYAAVLDTYLAGPAGEMAPFPAVDLPPLSAYVPEPCATCAATGWMHTVECRACRGSGMTECPTCHHEDACDDCGGTGNVERPSTTEDDPDGRIECMDCDGTGDRGDKHAVPHVPTRVGPYSIDRRYVVVMQALPGIEIDLGREDWFVGAPHKYGVTVVPVRFRFDGGEGAIVPLRGGAKVETAGASQYDQSRPTHTTAGR